MTLVCHVDTQNQSAQVLTWEIPGFVASLGKRISELGSLKTWDFIKDISMQTLRIGIKIGIRKERWTSEHRCGLSKRSHSGHFSSMGA